jgi:hypothetical protein
MHGVLRQLGVRRGLVRKDYFDGLVDSDVSLPRVPVRGGTLAAWKSWAVRGQRFPRVQTRQGTGRNPSKAQP